MHHRTLNLAKYQAPEGDSDDFEGDTPARASLRFWDEFFELEELTKLMEQTDDETDFLLH